VRFYRESNADGTITLRLGTKTATFTVNAYANAAWHEISIGTFDSDGYYRNFKEDYNNQGVRVEVELTGHTTGTITVDDVILRQAYLWDGKPIMITSGRDDFLLGDTNLS